MEVNLDQYELGFKIIAKPKKIKVPYTRESITGFASMFASKIESQIKIDNFSQTIRDYYYDQSKIFSINMVYIDEIRGIRRQMRNVLSINPDFSTMSTMSRTSQELFIIVNNFLDVNTVKNELLIVLKEWLSIVKLLSQGEIAPIANYKVTSKMRTKKTIDEKEIALLIEEKLKKEEAMLKIGNKVFLLKETSMKQIEDNNTEQLAKIVTEMKSDIESFYTSEINRLEGVIEQAYDKFPVLQPFHELTSFDIAVNVIRDEDARDSKLFYMKTFQYRPTTYVYTNISYPIPEDISRAITTSAKLVYCCIFLKQDYKVSAIKLFKPVIDGAGKLKFVRFQHYHGFSNMTNDCHGNVQLNRIVTPRELNDYFSYIIATYNIINGDSLANSNPADLPTAASIKTACTANARTILGWDANTPVNTNNAEDQEEVAGVIDADEDQNVDAGEEEFTEIANNPQEGEAQEAPAWVAPPTQNQVTGAVVEMTALEEEATETPQVPVDIDEETGQATITAEIADTTQNG
jgi:hypothetical protein